MARKAVSATIQLPRLRPDQWQIASCSAQYVVVAMGRRWGKALDITTPILTVNRGWQTMETIQVGDYVYDERHQPTKVMDVAPIQNDHVCYEIVFEDGEGIVADSEHEWLVNDTTILTTWQLWLHQTERLQLITSAATHRIVSVDVVISRPVRCIMVDSPSHLYLVTKSFIPTHNSMTGFAVSTSTSIAGARVAWVVPTYKNGRALWSMVVRALAPLINTSAVRMSQVERTIEFTQSGGFLGVFSATNEDAIRGEAFHLVVLDEAARIPETAWTDAIQPTLADFGGKAILISTPKGKGNWFYREWLRGWVDQAHTEREPGYMSFKAPSSANPNPKIQQAARDAIRRVSARTYQQEWLAEFLEDGGAVFQFVRRQATAKPQLAPIQAHTYVIGCDWGKLNDWTVYAVLDCTLGEIVRLERYRAEDYAEGQVGHLVALFNRFRANLIVPERNAAGEVIIEILNNMGLPVEPVYTTQQMKETLIEGLAVALEQDQVRIIDDAGLIDELEAYESRTLPSGKLVYGAPAGAHDDRVMAAALAVYGQKKVGSLAPMVRGKVASLGHGGGTTRPRIRRTRRGVYYPQG